MKKSTIIYCSIIAVLFVSVLYLLFLNFNKTPATNTLIPKSGVISTSDPTADWKVYENKLYGFSFKYPSNYLSTYENDRKDSGGLTTIHSSDYVVNKEELAYTHGSAFYYVDIKNSQCSEIKNQISSTPTFKLVNAGELKNTTIFEIYDKLSSQFPFRGALVSINDKCIEMYCNSTKQGCTDNELGKEFSQILSTFKFTQPSTSDLRSQVENWTSYTQSPTKLSWDKCDGESTISSSLKGMMAVYPVFIKEIDGLKLAYTSKLDFTAQDVAKFTLCEAGNFYPIYTFNDKILWTNTCSTGIAPDNPKCEDTLTQIQKLYGYTK
ncbi:MAG: hypothetical protein WC596_01710 [Candidatus Shapirobacteria bacterium]